MGKPRAKIWRSLYLTSLGLAAGLNVAVPLHRPLATRLVFGVLPFFIGYAFARHGRLFDRVDRPGRKVRSDQGRWLDAPIAEVDKSTTGLLLANRWRRDPSLRVIAKRGGQESTPRPHGGLWDRDLDG